MFRKFLLLVVLVICPFAGECKLPDITPQVTTSKLNEIMQAHATYKQLNDELVKRALQNYMEILDPNKSYFTEPDIDQWLHPSKEVLEQILAGYKNSDYSVFENIHNTMAKAILRRKELEKKIDLNQLPKNVHASEFKDMKWAANEQDLLNRIIRIKALQIETAAKLNEELRSKSMQRIAKNQMKYEEEIQNPDPVHKQHLILSNVLKATASALDAHTVYFTPDEASQFMLQVQQRLFGIGAQLRDDLNGFTVVKIIEGSPAALGKQLKVKDRIVAVNGEPVVGMDIVEAVDLIRGEENTPVTLTVIRETGEGEQKKEEKIDIVIPRGEVVLKETRYESSYEPFGTGVIGYVRLYSFYQDPEFSSTTDIEAEIKKLKEEHKLLGLVLDLRSNSGGMLSQAVGVTGLFITKGVVVSIKDDEGHIQHLRDIDGRTAFDGPLIVLINRGSASASEIVAGTLQDYGRALIVGDDHTYGKGSFQTFTLNTTSRTGNANPQGEYKVTRGRYYTVSGRTPQLVGVAADIFVPGPLSELDIGEKFGKYPLENDHIAPQFDDDLLDVPLVQREKIKLLYKFNLQPKLAMYAPYVEQLKKNTAYRIEHNKGYQKFLKDIKKKDKDIEDEEEEKFGQNDLQLAETYNIMKDLIEMMNTKQP